MERTRWSGCETSFEALESDQIEMETLFIGRLCRNVRIRMIVILNGVKNLIILTESIAEILRLPPQNDIATQSPREEAMTILISLSA